MEKNILFKERQRFNQWWLWLLLLALDGFFLYAVYTQRIKGIPFGAKPMSDNGLLVPTSIVLLVTLLFLLSRLDTEIREDGVYVRFFPLHWAFKRYTWKDISKMFVRRYHPLGEYGGWGVRGGFGNTGKAYNTSGNKGLQLELNDHSRLLIGTQKMEELSQLLKRLDDIKR